MSTRRAVAVPAITLIGALLIVTQLAQAAFAATTVDLLSKYVGATNPGFVVDKPDCGPAPTGEFMWRFALVWIDQDTRPGVLSASFEHSGVIENSNPVLYGGGNEQKFFVYTDVPDRLLDASVTFEGEQSGEPPAPALKLSGVMQGCSQPPQPAPASVGVKLGACAFEGVSLTPATVTITPPGAATVHVTGPNGYAKTLESGATLSLRPGSYKWTATAKPSYHLNGRSSAAFAVGACDVEVKPQGFKKPPLPKTGASLPGIGAAGFGFVLLGLMMVSASRRPAFEWTASLPMSWRLRGRNPYVALITLPLLYGVVSARSARRRDPMRAARRAARRSGK